MDDYNIVAVQTFQTYSTYTRVASDVSKGAELGSEPRPCGTIAVVLSLLTQLFMQLLRGGLVVAKHHLMMNLEQINNKISRNPRSNLMVGKQVANVSTSSRHSQISSCKYMYRGYLPMPTSALYPYSILR